MEILLGSLTYADLGCVFLVARFNVIRASREIKKERSRRKTICHFNVFMTGVAIVKKPVTDLQSKSLTKYVQNQAATIFESQLIGNVELFWTKRKGAGVYTKYYEWYSIICMIS